ncbi:hypothetical protein P3T18_003420 [Paraburkholderia sp. GAS199]|uniref:DUF4148 domain-containing protein n=1 Tax=Paraburkholderia sp. GAS199 TaxID=3035126 RepID=UPI003D1AC02A
MKSLINAVALTLALAAPLAAFAQSNQPANQPVTRAQVRAELIQLEKAGYNPGIANNDTYPAEIQAAEARVATQNSAAQTDTSGVGGVASGSAAVGAHKYVPEADRKGPRSIYFGQ